MTPTLREVIARVLELDRLATPGEWYWGEGFEERVGPCSADEDESDGGNKYLDCCLQNENENIIPVRVDHHEPIWDCNAELDAPSEGDRNLIAEYRTKAPYLASRLEAVLDAGMEAFLDEVIASDQLPRAVHDPAFPNAVLFTPIDGPLAQKARAVKAALAKALEDQPATGAGGTEL